MYHDTRVHLYPSHGAIHFMLVGGPTKKTKPLSQQSKPWSVYCSHFIHFSILVERKGTHSKSWKLGRKRLQKKYLLQILAFWQLTSGSHFLFPLMTSATRPVLFQPPLKLSMAM